MQDIYFDIMKSLLEHSNPLFGRIDLVIDLKQMDYYESSLFYPEMTDEDKVRIYQSGKSTTPDRLDQTWMNCVNLFDAEYNV